MTRVRDNKDAYSVPSVRTASPEEHSRLQQIFRDASLSNPGDREMLNAHPEFLILGDEAILSQRTRVAIDSAGTMLGFASYKITGDAFELEDLFVDPSFWRRGVATALVDNTIAVPAQRGFAGIWVTGNPHALPFYESAGFYVEGEVHTVFYPAPRLYRATL